jgi:hypothetical protein
MGLPKCLSGYSSISWTFTECEKQMNIICFRKKSKNFLGILTFGASLELPELLPGQVGLTRSQLPAHAIWKKNCTGSQPHSRRPSMFTRSHFPCLYLFLTVPLII